MAQHSPSSDPLPLRLLGDLVTCLGFFSRLPASAVRVGPRTIPVQPLTQAICMLPVAGLIIGGCGALPMIAAIGAGLPGPIAVLLGGVGSVLATGGLHEDGLADTADGLGGGATRERKLAIMRDSRIGTYGVLAIVMALLLRLGALTALLDRAGPGAAAAALLAAAAVSRALALLPLALLPPARSDGLGRSIGRPDRTSLRICFSAALAIGVLGPSAAGFDPAHALLACAAAAGASALITRLAQRQIGGHTGDIGGASQQASEIAYLLGLLLFPDHA